MSIGRWRPPDAGRLAATRQPSGGTRDPRRQDPVSTPGNAVGVKNDTPIRLEIDFDQFVQRLAEAVAAHLPTQTESTSPWMTMEEAIAYSRIPEGTFRKLAARGEIPSHGGRRRLFHRAELDAALGYVEQRAPGERSLRRAS